MPYEFTPRELKAALDHRFFMGIEQNRNIPLLEAHDDFLRRYEKQWSAAIRKQDAAEEQLRIKEEISKRRVQGDFRPHGEIALELATGPWAAEWRTWRESLAANGFATATRVVHTPRSLTDLLRDCDCCVFAHKPGMQNYDFLLVDGDIVKNPIKTPYIDAKATPLSIERGDKLYFITIGAAVPDALERLRALQEELCYQH
jgi:hypothetical protein